jgi:PBP4 family serine-type D-alanyl-D-alanine carboxypeptidase
MGKKFLGLSILCFALFCNNNFSFQANNNNSQQLTSSDSLKSLLDLQYQINSVLNDKFISGSKYGISVYSLNDGKNVYKKNAESLLTPASNTKLFTSFALLSYLGENFRVKTSAYIDSAKIENGVLYGDVYLYGRGDVFLGISDIEEMAQQIENMGVKKIVGNICADASFYDADYYRKSYSGDNEEVEPTGPVYPLSIERNQITVLVKSDSRIGSLAHVQVIPNSNSFVIRNSAVAGTGGVVKGKGKKKRVVGPPPLGVRLNREGDKTVIYVSGAIAPNRTANYSYFNYAPDLTAAGVFKERLGIVGVKVEGSVIAKTCPAIKTGKAKEIAKFGRPVSDIMYWVNKKSDNFLAENLFKILGGHYGKYTSTAKSAREAVIKQLDTNKIPYSGIVLNDGCGLSRRNLITPDALARLLMTANKKNLGKVLDSTLPIAGVDGTLRKRMVGTAAQNNLRAKTGTLRNASSLAGLVKNKSGELFVFSMVFNGPSVGYYKQTENKIGEILANFQYTKHN